MNLGTEFWNGLIELNRKTDGLIERVRRAVEPSQPISREVPFFASLETRFDNLPLTYGATVNPGSDALEGANLKRASFTNGGSRVYVREMTFTPFRMGTVTSGAFSYAARQRGDRRAVFPFNWRWNFLTSITQRQYSVGRGGAGVRVSGLSAGRYRAGNHIAFREPLVLEPMETLTLEVELLSFGMKTAENASLTAYTIAVVAMSMSGYREGF